MSCSTLTVAIFQRQVILNFRQAKNQSVGMLHILGGSFCPLIGVSVPFAIQKTDIGIANDHRPTTYIPAAGGSFHIRERITLKAVAGTLLAISGVGLLFWL
jgi:hypothetical protein